MVDKKLLVEKITLLTGYINDLEEQSGASVDQIKRDKVLRRYIERTLHIAVEACLDIGNHIIADLGLREPEDNKDIIRVITEHGYLPDDKLAGFQKMAQFRNVIVQDYARIDPEILCGILRKNIEDLRLFARVIRDELINAD